MEATTVDQKHELDRLREEKRSMERAVYKLEAHGDRGGPLHDFFRSSEIAELPPRLRAIFEENKVSSSNTQQLLGRASSLLWACCITAPGTVAARRGCADHEGEAPQAQGAHAAARAAGQPEEQPDRGAGGQHIHAQAAAGGAWAMRQCSDANRGRTADATTRAAGGPTCAVPQACSRTPADVEREETLKDQLFLKERRVAVRGRGERHSSARHASCAHASGAHRTPAAHRQRSPSHL